MMDIILAHALLVLLGMGVTVCVYIVAVKLLELVVLLLRWPDDKET